MVDVLICSVPAGIINRPPAAPALLKACVIDAGFSAKTEDFSLLLYANHCGSDYTVYSKINKMFEPLTDWNNNNIVASWLNNCISTVVGANPKFLAISVFSIFQHRATVLLCEEIKKQLPSIKIILGGYGLPESCHHTLQKFRPLTAREKLLKFSDYMKMHDLADYFVFGEGEQQLVDIVSQQTNTVSPVDLDLIPFSDFDDYKLDQYLWHNRPVLMVTGSKGCVRNCTFCNVPQKFGRYRRKTGKRIAEEIIWLSQKYHVYKFEFTDSLVNGSIKDFEECITALAEYNNTAQNPVSWYGQYICRPQAQTPQRLYQLMKESGAVNLIIGAESGSNAVLEAMNKKITVQDIFDELDQFERYGLQAQLLVMGSFYNETWDRFVETLDFISKCHRYLASGVISRIATGLPLFIEPNGYLHQHADQLGIVLDEHNFYNWKVVNDPTNTWLERIRRRLIMQALLQSMGVSMTGNGILELEHMTEQLKLYEQQIRSPDSRGYKAITEFGPH